MAASFQDETLPRALGIQICDKKRSFSLAPSVLLQKQEWKQMLAMGVAD